MIFHFSEETFYDFQNKQMLRHYQTIKTILAIDNKKTSLIILTEKQATLTDIKNGTK